MSNCSTKSSYAQKLITIPAIILVISAASGVAMSSLPAMLSGMFLSGSGIAIPSGIAYEIFMFAMPIVVLAAAVLILVNANKECMLNIIAFATLAIIAFYAADLTWKLIYEGVSSAGPASDPWGGAWSSVVPMRTFVFSQVSSFISSIVLPALILAGICKKKCCCATVIDAE